MKDTENAVLHLEKGLYYSNEYDELPAEVKHTSLLVKDDVEDLSEVYNGTQMNRVSYEINEFIKIIGDDASIQPYIELLRMYS